MPQKILNKQDFPVENVITVGISIHLHQNDPKCEWVQYLHESNVWQTYRQLESPRNLLPHPLTVNQVGHDMPNSLCSGERHSRLQPVPQNPHSPPQTPLHALPSSSTGTSLLPMPTATAPSARALTVSVPHLIPPSTKIPSLAVVRGAKRCGAYLMISRSVNMGACAVS
ncbi:hypothetical protein CGRA01v4_09587 [Colletotrichum graminicola]|nr:hypothetical protein CGRA01v4_09587 [Colletotrichum graminicola]